ncbi:ZIP family metal transporter [Ponticaulis sp.]|uniref:ZIP family metal transporter n=1 Tax=Ponticaulis sp. TaxID=2020902 RepID=UPI00261F88D1|nr:ZIP family metal transporter [Ponticaulis sp.]MDF1678947.1 ZIP family metal transporter [Ponticaulis sp.]
MFATPLLATLFLTSLAAFIAALGLITVSIRSDWSQKYGPVFALIASGLLLTMVITHLAPEALAGGPLASYLMLGGFFLGLFVHDILRTLLPVADPRTLAAGLTPLIAISIHSFLDGMIYTISFSQGMDTGLYATMGLVLHEFPEAIITFALLRAAGISNRLSFILAFLAAGVTTPLGTIAMIPLAYTVDMSILSLLFAVSAGLLLFVSTGPLMAHMKAEHPIRSIPALGVGIAIALVIGSAGVGHVAHENASGHVTEGVHAHD